MEKKLMAAILCVLLTLGIVGCGKTATQENDSGSERTQGSNAGETEGDSDSRSDIVDITMAYIILNTSASDMDMVEAAVNEISEKEIGVHVNIEAISIGDYTTQVNLMLASASEPLDIIQALTSNFSAWYSSGGIVPFDDELQTYGQGIIKAVGEDYLKAGQIDGRQYGITTNRDLATDYGFAFRTDLIEQYNIDVSSIKTLDDIETILRQVTEADPSITPLTSNTEGALWFNVIGRYGVDPLGDYLGVLADMTDSNMVVENLFESEKYKDFVMRMREWYENGYIQTDASTSSEVGAPLLRSGKAFGEIVTGKPGLTTQIQTETGYPMTFVAVADADTCTTTVQTLQYAIAQNSEHVDKAVQFLNLLYTNEDVANLLAWGIEGKHYVVTDDGHITFPEGVDANNSGYNLNQGWLVGNQFITHVWEGDDIDIWQQLDDFNKNATVSNAMGFSFDTQNVKTEYAACSAVLEQYRVGLECGAMDPESTLKDFNDALYSAGLQKIIDEKQKQLDAWLETK